MSVLKLNVAKKYFDLIESGEKTEEYREFKKHWIKQLFSRRFSRDEWRDEAGILEMILEHKEHYLKNRLKKFESVEFKNGYSKNAPTIVLECKGISIGKPLQQGSELFNENVFIIHLGGLFPPAV